MRKLLQQRITKLFELDTPNEAEEHLDELIYFVNCLEEFLDNQSPLQSTTDSFIDDLKGEVLYMLSDLDSLNIDGAFKEMAQEQQESEAHDKYCLELWRE